MRIIAATLIILSIFSVNTANAELKITDPSEVCAFLQDLGLVTRGWKNHYENVFGCSSSYKELSSGSSLANNLAFYAEGNSTAVSQTKLVLNINNPISAKAAHEELLKAAEVMSIKTTGEKLPSALKKAIKTGKKASAKVRSASVDVTRENWPTGKGYEIKVVIN